MKRGAVAKKIAGKIAGEAIEATEATGGIITIMIFSRWRLALRERPKLFRKRRQAGTVTASREGGMSSDNHLHQPPPLLDGTAVGKGFANENINY